jgi:isochorismate pyruvate lyase
MERDFGARGHLILYKVESTHYQLNPAMLIVLASVFTSAIWEGPMTQRVYSAAPWEKKVGYCRAIKKGNLIFVTGTAAVDDQGKTFEPGNAYAQAKRCLFLIERALEELGAHLSCVVRTRMFVTDISKWQEFGRAHGEQFRDFPPATTMVEVKALIEPDMLIEIEADAVLSPIDN